MSALPAFILRSTAASRPFPDPDILPLVTQHLIDARHDIILLGVVRVIFRRNLQYGGDSLCVVGHEMADIIGDVLIDEDNAHIGTRCEVPERLLDSRHLGVRLDYQVIAIVDCAVPNTC